MSDEMSIIPEESKAKLRRLMELREARDKAKAAKDAAEEAYREMEAEVFESLEGIEGALKIPLGPPWGTVSFSRRETMYSKIFDPEALQEYLEKRAMVDEIVSTQFAKGRLNEIARQADEAGEELPPGLSAYKQRVVAIKRQKS